LPRGGADAASNAAPFPEVAPLPGTPGGTRRDDWDAWAQSNAATIGRRKEGICCIISSGVMFARYPRVWHERAAAGTIPWNSMASGRCISAKPLAASRAIVGGAPIRASSASGRWSGDSSSFPTTSSMTEVKYVNSSTTDAASAPPIRDMSVHTTNGLLLGTSPRRPSRSGQSVVGTAGRMQTILRLILKSSNGLMTTASADRDS